MNMLIRYFKSAFVFRLVVYVAVLLIILNIQRILEWTSGIDTTVCVLSGIFIILAIINELRLRYKRKGKLKDVINNDSLTALLDDQPTIDDTLGRRRYAELLGRKIISTFLANQQDKTHIHGSFAINVEENYGYGKTSFLMMLHQWLEDNHKNEFTWIDFKPWLCDNVSSLVSEYFKQLSESTAININLQDDLIEYGEALASQTITILTKYTLPVHSYYNRNSLKEKHDAIFNGLQNEKRLIVVTVDDLDRLDKEEVLAVLKIIRDTADFPNIFYITASEHDYLHNVLSDSGVKDPNRYLEKFFNLTYYLPGHEVQYGDILEQDLWKYINDNKFGKEKIKEFNSLFKLHLFDTCFSDMRDLKRFVNQALSYVETLAAKDYNLFDAVLLSLLQYKCPETYKLLRDNHDVLLDSKKQGNDKLYVLKYDYIAEVNTEKFRQYKANKDREKYTPQDIKHLSDVINRPEIKRNEEVGESILDQLFGKNRSGSETSVNRENRYFLYFAGHEASRSITREEVEHIMDLDMPKYKEAISTIFDEHRDRAFIQEVGYVIYNRTDKAIEYLNKFFVFLDKDYEQTPPLPLRNRFEHAYKNDDFDQFVYTLLSDPNYHRLGKLSREPVDLTELIKTGYIPYMVCLLDFIDRDISVYSYTRDTVESYQTELFNRFFTEKMNVDIFSSDEDLAVAGYYREEFDYRDLWDTKFTEYLDSDKEVLLAWLRNIFEKYEVSGRYGWNFNVKDAMFGSRLDSRGEVLLNNLKSVYPELSNELDGLKALLQTADIDTADLSNNKFVKDFAKLK